MEPRIFAHVLEGVPFSVEERAHLAQCEVCQQDVAALALLQTELEVARQSQLSPGLEARLFAVLAQVQLDDSQQSPQPSSRHNMLDVLVEWVAALPLWDSRRQAGALGVRNATQTSYRLLFGAGETEVELMVEPHNGMLRVVGEVLIPETDAAEGVALIELVEQSSHKPHADSLASIRALEVESDRQGRFVLEQVPPGAYVMTVTPCTSRVVVIEPLELT